MGSPIQIYIKVKSRIRIRTNVGRRIRIRIKVTSSALWRLNVKLLKLIMGAVKANNGGSADSHHIFEEPDRIHNKNEKPDSDQHINDTYVVEELAVKVPVGSTLMRKILSVYMRSRNSGCFTQEALQLRPSRKLKPSLSLIITTANCYEL
jgi:hypothetical protein